MRAIILSLFLISTIARAELNFGSPGPNGGGFTSGIGGTPPITGAPPFGGLPIGGSPPFGGAPSGGGLNPLALIGLMGGGGGPQNCLGLAIAQLQQCANQPVNPGEDPNACNNNAILLETLCLQNQPTPAPVVVAPPPPPPVCVDPRGDADDGDPADCYRDLAKGKPGVFLAPGAVGYGAPGGIPGGYPSAASTGYTPGSSSNIAIGSYTPFPTGGTIPYQAPLPQPGPSYAGGSIFAGSQPNPGSVYVGGGAPLPGNTGYTGGAYTGGTGGGSTYVGNGTPGLGY